MAVLRGLWVSSPTEVLLVTVVMHLPEGGEAEQKTVQWIVFPPNARSGSSGPGAQALPGGAVDLDFERSLPTQSE